MVGWPSVLLSGELGELAEDVRRIFQELGQGPGAHAGAAGDCVPPLDVLETDGAVQILMDLPGVPPSSVRVLLKGDVVLIAGEKWAEGARREPGAFHLVERGSGRFARAVHISGAFDGARLFLSQRTLSSSPVRQWPPASRLQRLSVS